MNLLNQRARGMEYNSGNLQYCLFFLSYYASSKVNHSHKEGNNNLQLSLLRLCSPSIANLLKFRFLVLQNAIPGEEE